ncbi:MAG: M23 family metallopeptidase [Thermotogae bacterium]|nr:M23 family metallopeptidase [Thermotogota bacterium]
MKYCWVFILLLCGTLMGLNVLEYEVRKGDTILSISRRFDISPSVLMDWNPQLFKEPFLRVGQRLKIPDANVIKHVVKLGENLWYIAHIYGVTLDDIFEATGLVGPIIWPGDEVYIPWEKIGSLLNHEASFCWPVYGVVSSKYGYRIHPITKKRSFHTGIDIAADEGTPVFSAINGVVTFAGPKDGYGYMVEISSGRRTTRYAHLSAICVYKGQLVRQGQMIGRVGNSGLSTGPHLHFEVMVMGHRKDPMAVLPPRSSMFAGTPVSSPGRGGGD